MLKNITTSVVTHNNNFKFVNLFVETFMLINSVCHSEIYIFMIQIHTAITCFENK